MRAEYILRQLFRRYSRVRYGLPDVQALHPDPITRDRHGMEGADTAIEVSAHLEGGATFGKGPNLP